MSTYRSSTTRLSPSIASLIDNLEGQYDSVRAGICSAEVASLAHEVAALPLDSSLATTAWSRIGSAMPSWQTALSATSLATMTAAGVGEIPLPAALNSVAVDLASIERLAVTETAAAALLGLGYTIQRVDGVRTSAIDARRGHETLLAVVSDQGRIETDHVGLADDSCNHRQRDFIDAMEHRGVLFDETVNIQHHDPRGGSPITNAARAGGHSLAEGAVIVGDSHASSFSTTLFDPSTNQNSRNAERARR